MVSEFSRCSRYWSKSIMKHMSVNKNYLQRLEAAKWGNSGYSSRDIDSVVCVKRQIAYLAHRF